MRACDVRGASGRRPHAQDPNSLQHATGVRCVAGRRGKNLSGLFKTLQNISRLSFKDQTHIKGTSPDADLEDCGCWRHSPGRVHSGYTHPRPHVANGGLGSAENGNGGGGDVSSWRVCLAAAGVPLCVVTAVAWLPRSHGRQNGTPSVAPSATVIAG